MTDQITRVRDHFSKNSAAWLQLYRNPKSAHNLILRDRLNLAVDLLVRNVPPDSRILDVGCGAGLATVRLASLGHVVHGIDISREMIDEARDVMRDALAPDIRFELTVGDVMKLDLEKRAWDGILALGFLEYQEDDLQPLRRFHALLRPGGVLVVSGPTKKPAATVFGLTEYVARRRGKQSVSLHRYSLSRMKLLLSEAGFDVKAHIRHGFAGFPWVERATGMRGGVLLHRFLSSLSEVLPIKPFCNDIIVCGIKICKEGHHGSGEN